MRPRSQPVGTLGTHGTRGDASSAFVPGSSRLTRLPADSVARGVSLRRAVVRHGSIVERDHYPRSGMYVTVGLPGNPFRDRPPTSEQMLRLRLVLATFKDGSGNLKMLDRTHRADWRQVERAFAEVFDGTTAESKAVFDIDIRPHGGSLPYGLSIKTSQRKADDRVLMELNNSPAKMLDHAVSLGYARRVNRQAEWACSVEEMGFSIMDAVKTWHEACRGTHDLAGSSYVVMTHDKPKNLFEVFWYPLALGNPKDLKWAERGRAITGTDRDGIVRWEFYRGSGGQVKWYPAGDAATWRSGTFGLPEPPPMRTLSDKARELFDDLWPD